MTIINIIIGNKFEVLQEWPKCDPETQSEQMPLEKWCWQTCLTKVATNIQFVKNKTKQNPSICRAQSKVQ